MKKLFAIALIVILTALTCACGAMTNEMEPRSAYDAPAEDVGYGYVDEEGYADYDDDESPTAAKATSSSTLNGSAAPPEIQKKIIKNAEVRMQSMDVKKTYAEILDFAQKNSGYQFSQSTRSNEEYTSIEAQIKIAPDKLDAFLEFIGECGDVTNCDVSASDITAEYFDTEIRLKAKRESLEVHYEILRNTTKTKEILDIQATIDAIIADIESMEGRLRYWNSQVDESTVTLSISQKDDPDAVEIPEIKWNALKFSDMGKITRNGLVAVVNTIYSVLQWLLMVLVILSPIWVPVGALIFWLVWRSRNKRKKLNAAVNQGQNPMG